MLWEKRERSLSSVCVRLQCVHGRAAGKAFILACKLQRDEKKDAATEEQRGNVVETSGGQWGNQRGFSHSVACKYSYLQHSHVS